MMITQTDVAAARAFLDNMNFDTSSERQVAIYAQAAADQRQAEIVDYLKQHGMAAVHMTLAAGLPGAKPHQRAKLRAFADGYGKAVVAIRDAIESGTWRTE